MNCTYPTMIQLLEQSKDDLVAFSISGNVSRSDYNVMLPLLEERIKQHGKIRVYAEVQDVGEYTLQALWEDIKFDMKHATDFSKAALVGDLTGSPLWPNPLPPPSSGTLTIASAHKLGNGSRPKYKVF